MSDKSYTELRRWCDRLEVRLESFKCELIQLRDAVRLMAGNPPLWNGEDVGEGMPDVCNSRRERQR